MDMESSVTTVLFSNNFLGKPRFVPFFPIPFSSVVSVPFCTRPPLLFSCLCFLPHFLPSCFFHLFICPFVCSFVYLSITLSVDIDLISWTAGIHSKHSTQLQLTSQTCVTDHLYSESTALMNHFSYWFTNKTGIWQVGMSMLITEFMLHMQIKS